MIPIEWLSRQRRAYPGLAAALLMVVLAVPAAATVIDTATFGGHTYYLTDPQLWSQAEAEAMGLDPDGHLAAVGSQAEQDFIWGTWSRFRILWIGLNDQASEGHFVWTNGEPVGYTNWGPGEPNDGLGIPGNSEDFVLMTDIFSHFQPGQWNDATGNPQTDIFNAVLEVPSIQSSVPEPATATLLGLGALGLILRVRRRPAGH